MCTFSKFGYICFWQSLKHTTEVKHVNINTYSKTTLKKTKYNIGHYKAIAEKNGGKCLNNELLNSKIKLDLICAENHRWSTFPSNLRRGFWCKSCSHKNAMSKFKKSITDCNKVAKKNNGVCLSTEYINANSKVIWQCEKGHIWKATYNGVQGGTWCNICSFQKTAEKLKLSIEDCHKTAFERNGLCLSKSYKNTQTKLTWQCNKGHVWESTYGNIRSGKWCRICSQKQTGLKRRTSIDFFKNYAINKDGECLSDTYENQNSKLEFKCSKGHIWKTTAGSMKASKTWCPICAGTFKVITEKQIVEKLDEVTKIALSKGGKCLSTTYINSKSKLKFQCSEGHIWETIPLIIKKGSWCNICTMKKVSEGQRDTIDDFIKIIRNKGGKCLSTNYINAQQSRIHVECKFGHRWYALPQGLKKGTWCRKCYGTAKSTLEEIKDLAKGRDGKCLSDNYVNDMTKMIWSCSENHIWRASPNNIKSGKWCPTCSKGIGERTCRLSFEKIFGEEFNSIRPDWLKNISGNKMELDGFNEKLKIAFEHQGRQHYSDSNVNIRYIKQSTIENDKQKAKICKKLGITIIYIPEVFTDVKLDDLITYIIKQLDKHNISYPKEAKNYRLNPSEVYTYTKNRELIEREKRAEKIIKNLGAKTLDIYRTNSGVKIRVKCKNNHILSTTTSQILKGIVCRKCQPPAPRSLPTS